MSKSAQLFRMATDEHICPFGLKSKDLLEREGYTVDDQLLTSREQTDEFKKQHSVETTPQTFIDNKLLFAAKLNATLSKKLTEKIAITGV